MKIDWSREVPELPVVTSTVSDLETKITGIVAKLDKLPLEAIGADLTKALASLSQTLEDASKAVNRIDSDVTPELKSTLDGLRGTFSVVDRTLNSADATLVGKDAPAQQDLRDALQEIARAARSLRILTDFLERHPESLIRGKTEGVTSVGCRVENRSDASNMRSSVEGRGKNREPERPGELRRVSEKARQLFDLVVTDMEMLKPESAMLSAGVSANRQRRFDLCKHRRGLWKVESSGIRSLSRHRKRLRSGNAGGRYERMKHWLAEDLVKQRIELLDEIDWNSDELDWDDEKKATSVE